MKRIECPHCYTVVVLEERADCPACGKNPDAASADRTRTKLVVRVGQKLPPLCFGCGESTDALFKVKWANSSLAGEIFAAIGSLVLFPIKLLLPGGFSLFKDDDEVPYLSVKVKVPLCRTCRLSDRLQIDSFDPANRRVAFIVPRKVATSATR